MADPIPSYLLSENIQTAWFEINKWQDAIDYAWRKGGGTVVASGTCVQRTALIMRPNVKLVSPTRNAVLTQAAGMNLGTLVDFAAGGAINSGLDGIIVDGNRNNNLTRSSEKTLIQLWDTDDVEIKRCKLRNSAGNAILGRRNKRARILDNDIHDNYNLPINLVSNTYDTLSDSIVRGNRIYGDYSQHCIYIRNLRGVRVQDNKITSYRLGTFSVAVSGRYCSSLSGNYFTPSCVNKFLIFDNGVEDLIEAYISPTQVYLKGTHAAKSGMTAVWGNGDTIVFDSSILCTADGNQLDGGASIGLSIFAFDNVCRGNTFRNNNLSGIGSCAISLQTRGALILDTVIDNNIITDCGQNRAAGAETANSGVFASAGTRVKVNNNIIVNYNNSMPYGILFGDSVSGKSSSGNIISGTTIAPIYNP